jgi:hypothetical protein
MNCSKKVFHIFLDIYDTFSIETANIELRDDSIR